MRDYSRKTFGVLLLAAMGLLSVDVTGATEKTVTATTPANGAAIPAFGTIRGIILDEKGNPISGAVIALFRDGVATVKQVRTTASGNFSTRVAPGRYTLTAMADGFSVVSLANVEVGSGDEEAYRFNLVRVGSGNTLPERRADRRQPKWRIRSNQSRRTIFQNTEGTGETTASVEKIETAAEPVEESNFSKPSQSAVETYFASSANGGNYAGLNFATIQPINENFDLIFAGQTGLGENAPQRLETTAKFKVSEAHRLSLNFSGAQLGTVQLDENSDEESKLGQLSFQAIDEWRVRDGVIVVFGFDYSRFVGASSADSFAPRLGLQFEADAKTRFNFAYTTQHEPRTWQQAADLEDARILFRQPNFDSYAVIEQQVLMPRLRRLEIGIERVLDNNSNIEATAFFDATNNRGVSFVNLPLGAFNEAEGNEFSNAIQNGSAQGLRVVYSRRLNSVFSTNIGYAFGRGQSLSSEGLTNPANLFEDEFFQTVTAQIAADFDTGTQVRTVWRFSPRPAVFAIDPFMGRMAFYEPSVSILVTQKLPTWGLPVRARAIFDARNLFDLQTAVTNGETSVRLNSARRALRGGIAVRF